MWFGVRSGHASSRIKRSPTFYSTSVNDCFKCSHMLQSIPGCGWLKKQIDISTLFYGYRSHQDAISSLKCPHRFLIHETKQFYFHLISVSCEINLFFVCFREFMNLRVSQTTTSVWSRSYRRWSLPTWGLMACIAEVGPPVCTAPPAC